MNANIKIGQTIKLDSSDVNQFRYGLDSQSIKTNLFLAQSTAKLNADGLYYCMKIEHSGHTRANQWYSHLTCLAVNASVPNWTSAVSSIPLSAGAIPRY